MAVVLSGQEGLSVSSKIVYLEGEVEKRNQELETIRAEQKSVNALKVSIREEIVLQMSDRHGTFSPRDRRDSPLGLVLTGGLGCNLYFQLLDQPFFAIQVVFAKNYGNKLEKKIPP